MSVVHVLPKFTIEILCQEKVFNALPFPGVCGGSVCVGVVEQVKAALMHTCSKRILFSTCTPHQQVLDIL